MTLEEVLIKQTFISKLLFKNESEELNKELKAKIMHMRIELGKFRKAFDADVQEAIKDIKPSNYDELFDKQDKTPEDEKELHALNLKIDGEYKAFIAEKHKEEVIFNKKFTEDEYFELVNVNSSNDIDINGNKLNGPDFLEIIYNLFVA
ncbi:MAG: hypothetical protein RSE41_09065 [Clostridia bacterium]